MTISSSPHHRCDVVEVYLGNDSPTEVLYFSSHTSFSLYQQYVNHMAVSSNPVAMLSSICTEHYNLRPTSNLHEPHPQRRWCWSVCSDISKESLLLMHLTVGLYTMIAGITWHSPNQATSQYSGVKFSQIGTRQRRSLHSVTQPIPLMHSKSRLGETLAGSSHTADLCSSGVQGQAGWSRYMNAAVVQLLPKFALCWLTCAAIFGPLSCIKSTIPGI